MGTETGGNGGNTPPAERQPKVWYALIVGGQLFGLFPREQDAKAVAEKFDGPHKWVVKPLIGPWPTDVEKAD